MRRPVTTLSEMGRRPQVTVVVPCYNYGHYLPACVESILSQDEVNVSVLIIDDASPDGSGEVADALADRDRRVTAIRHVVNKGHIATYNEGLEQVTSDYVALLSADDLLTPGALARSTALMEANPSVGLAYGNPLVFWDDSIPVARVHVRSWTVWPGPQWIAAQCRRGQNAIYSPEALVRTSIQHQVGGYSAALPHSGDLEMWLRIAAVADVGHVNGPDHAMRRVHGKSMMNTTFSDGVDLRLRQEAYEAFFGLAGAGLADRGSLLAQTRRVTAEDSLNLARQLLSAPDYDAELVGRCEDLARDMLPDIESTSAWRRYELYRAHRTDRRPLSVARRQAYRVKNDLAGRLAWQKWHRFGV